MDELNKLDGEETARRLIENGGGTITPYGVVYDNGMKLEQIYADKANARLKKKYFKIAMRSKANIAKTAVAREMACFIWGMMTDNISCA